MADRYWGENIFSEYSVSGVLAASLLFSALIRTLAAKATPKKYAFTPRCQTSDRKVIDPKFKMLKNFICRSSIKSASITVYSDCPIDNYYRYDVGFSIGHSTKCL